MIRKSQQIVNWSMKLTQFTGIFIIRLNWIKIRLKLIYRALFQSEIQTELDSRMPSFTLCTIISKKLITLQKMKKTLNSKLISKKNPKSMLLKSTRPSITKDKLLFTQFTPIIRHLAIKMVALSMFPYSPNNIMWMPNTEHKSSSKHINICIKEDT